MDSDHNLKELLDEYLENENSNLGDGYQLKTSKLTDVGYGGKINFDSVSGLGDNKLEEVHDKLYTYYGTLSEDTPAKKYKKYLTKLKIHLINSIINLDYIEPRKTLIQTVYYNSFSIVTAENFEKKFYEFLDFIEVNTFLDNQKSFNKKFFTDFAYGITYTDKTNKIIVNFLSALTICFYINQTVYKESSNKFHNKKLSELLKIADSVSVYHIILYVTLQDETNKYILSNLNLDKPRVIVNELIEASNNSQYKLFDEDTIKYLTASNVTLEWFKNDFSIDDVHRDSIQMIAYLDNYNSKTQNIVNLVAKQLDNKVKKDNPIKTDDTDVLVKTEDIVNVNIAYDMINKFKYSPVKLGFTGGNLLHEQIIGGRTSFDIIVDSTPPQNNLNTHEEIERYLIKKTIEYFTIIKTNNSLNKIHFLFFAILDSIIHDRTKLSLRDINRPPLQLNEPTEPKHYKSYLKKIARKIGRDATKKILDIRTYFPNSELIETDASSTLLNYDKEINEDAVEELYTKIKPLKLIADHFEKIIEYFVTTENEDYFSYYYDFRKYPEHPFKTYLEKTRSFFNYIKTNPIGDQIKATVNKEDKKNNDTIKKLLETIEKFRKEIDKTKAIPTQSSVSTTNTVSDKKSIFRNPKPIPRTVNPVSLYKQATQTGGISIEETNLNLIRVEFIKKLREFPDISDNKFQYENTLFTVEDTKGKPTDEKLLAEDQKNEKIMSCNKDICKTYYTFLNFFKSNTLKAYNIEYNFEYLPLTYSNAYNDIMKLISEVKQIDKIIGKEDTKLKYINYDTEFKEKMLEISKKVVRNKMKSATDLKKYNFLDKFDKTISYEFTNQSFLEFKNKTDKCSLTRPNPDDYLTKPNPNDYLTKLTEFNRVYTMNKVSDMLEKIC